MRNCLSSDSKINVSERRKELLEERLPRQELPLEKLPEDHCPERDRRTCRTNREEEGPHQSCRQSDRPEDWERRERAKENAWRRRIQRRSLSDGAFGDLLGGWAENRRPHTRKREEEKEEEKEAEKEEEKEEEHPRHHHADAVSCDCVDEALEEPVEALADDRVEEELRAPHPQHHLPPRKRASREKSRLLHGPDREPRFES